MNIGGIDIGVKTSVAITHDNNARVDGLTGKLLAPPKTGICFSGLSRTWSVNMLTKVVGQA